jgi:hypothetical protein
MRLDLLPAVLLPAGMIAFGVLLLRMDDPRLTPQNRVLLARLAIIAGIGGLIIGLARIASGT